MSSGSEELLLGLAIAAFSLSVVAIVLALVALLAKAGSS